MDWVKSAGKLVKSVMELTFLFKELVKSVTDWVKSLMELVKSETDRVNEMGPLTPLASFWWQSIQVMLVVMPDKVGTRAA